MLHGRGPQCLIATVCYAWQEPATLDFVYVTDNGRHLLHYIMSGISENHSQLSRLYTSEDVTCRSTHSAQRAKLLSWLLQRTPDLDWNVTDAGCAPSTFLYRFDGWCFHVLSCLSS
jgi:hypothetical protein